MRLILLIKKHRWYLILLGFLAVYLLSKSFNSHKSLIDPAPVEVAKIAVKDFPLIVTFAGKTQAYDAVDVLSQVTGQIAQVNFKEGATVSKGDLLFQIDPRKFEDNLKLAEAALAKDTAQLEFAEKDLVRYQTLNEQKYVSDEQFDQAKTNRDSLLAAVEGDKANIASAKLMLQYCNITAPVSGIVGQIAVTTGNVVQANTGTPLTTIMQIEPIYIDFDVDSKNFDLMRKIKNIETLPVSIQTDAGVVLKDAKILFLNNNINPETGSVTIKAVYANDNLQLWSNQFVKVSVTMELEKDAIIIPISAVLENQNGKYVFVIDEQNTAHIRQIQLGITNDTQAQVIAGLKKDEVVVTNGQIRLAEGIVVKNINSSKGAR